MNNRESRIPDLLLERYRLGELDAPRVRRLEERLRRDAALRRRLEEMERSDREILGRYRPADMADGIHARLTESTGRPRLPVFGLTAAAAGAFALVLIILVTPGLVSRGNGATAEPVEVVRSKGDAVSRNPVLSVYLRQPSGAELLKNGATVHTRDTIQLRYEAAGGRYGVILSIDGRGQITRHFPLSASGSNELRHGNVLLPNSFELDDVPDFEKFFLVTSADTFDQEVVFAAARALVRSGRPVKESDLTLPADFHQTALLLLKEPR